MLHCRYEERLPHSALEDQDYAEDQIADAVANPTDTSGAGRNGGRDERLWREDDEEFYNEDQRASAPSSSRLLACARTRACDADRPTDPCHRPAAAPNQQHWHYPANFEGAGESTVRPLPSRLLVPSIR